MTPAVGPATSFADPTDAAAYAEAVDRFLSGGLSPDEFKRLRHLAGVYVQRGGADHMVRARVPAGLLSAGQTESLARAARLAGGRAHITTRQNLQFYGLPLKGTVELVRFLAEVGVTTRGASGNVVRNVAVCSLAGICPHETLDARPGALALTRHFLRRGEFENLPRKFKVSVSGCGKDCSFARFQDFGAVAIEEGGRRGFRLFAGGGLGARPRPASLLASFVPEDELSLWCEAVVRVFDRQGDRGSRARGRLKFLVERLGEEAFQKATRETLQECSPKKDGPAPLLADEVPAVPSSLLIAETSEAKAWRDSNVEAQKQEGFFAVTASVPAGDVTADQLLLLAHIARLMGNGSLRLTPEQNVLIPYLREESLVEAHDLLSSLGLGAPSLGRARGVVACPGTSSCPSALVDAKAMAGELENFFRGEGKSFQEADVRIRISGCPNSCSAPPLADIGLSGRALRMGGRDVPCYALSLGGCVGEDGPILGVPVAVVPARRVPQVLQSLLACRQNAVGPQKAFKEFLKGMDAESLSAFLSPHLAPPEDPADWGGREPYTINVSHGEC